MTGFTTDKVTPHGYLPDYLRLAADLGTAAVVCEVGVKGGDSLVMWQHLFPDSPAVIGVDNDPNATWPEGTHRIVAGQDDPGLAEKVREFAPDGYDLIVDDASTSAPSQRRRSRPCGPWSGRAGTTWWRTGPTRG